VEAAMSFKDLALPMIDLGIPVDIVQPFDKACWRRGYRGTLDRGQVIRWDKQNPDYNVACFGSPDGVVILDCDTPGLAARIEKETGQKLPRTLTVKSAGKGCAHFYFKQTEASRRLGNRRGADGQQKLFDLQSDGLYVVGPGSRLKREDGSIGVYEMWRKPPIAEFPDYLEAWIEKYPDMRRKGSKEGDKTAVEIVIDRYLQNLDPEDMFGIPNLVFGDVHNTLKSIGAYLVDENRSWDEIAELLERLGVEYGHRKPQRKDTVGYTDWLEKHNAKPMDLEPLNLPETYHLGLKIFATKEEKEAFEKEQVYASYKARMEEASKPPQSGGFVSENSGPRYPIDVWAGTEYGEFMEICSRGNFIPPEFLVEAIKTVTGAVLGSALSIPEIEGGVPRFYTVLIGGAGAGKGTSIAWASSVFEDIPLGGTAVTSLLWSPATKIESVEWSLIGACKEGFNSAPGMQRSNQHGQKRWLQTFEELDHMIEGSGIDGSGKALMGVNRQLYDREDFATTTTGKRDAIAGKAQNSILSGTTPEIWTDMFAGKSVRGSGLFQRFNLIVSNENRKKGSLRKPQLEVFKSNFAAKIMEMDKNPPRISLGRGVEGAMDEWFTQDRFSNPEIDGEVRGRLNVLAWRNALHLAWLRGLAEIGTRELQDAFLLSEYQFEMRLRHTPAEGDNSWALVENKIRNYLRTEKKATRREIVRALNLHRYGSGTTDKALSVLKAAGDIELFTEEGRGPRSMFAVWQD
jgi:Bifunctional DNA primase/polymerase, N-terminal